MTERKRICINCAVVVLEALLLCKDSGNIGLLNFFIICNAGYYGIRSVRATARFTEMLRTSNYMVFQRHQWALDSRNILKIDRALRKEELNEEERTAMQAAMNYLAYAFWMTAVPVIVFIAKNFF